MGNERVRNVTETLGGFTHGVRNGRKLGEKGSKGTIRNGRGGVGMNEKKFSGLCKCSDCHGGRCEKKKIEMTET